MNYFTIVILIFCLILANCGCGNKDMQNKSSDGTVSGSQSKHPTPKQKIETYHSKRIRVDGEFMRGEPPVLKLWNMSVSNRKGIVHLQIPENITQTQIGKNKIWYGDHIIVIGIARTEGLDIPEIIVEKMQKIQ